MAFLRDPVFVSVEHQRVTDRHDYGIYRDSIASRGKKTSKKLAKTSTYTELDYTEKLQRKNALKLRCSVNSDREMSPSNRLIKAKFHYAIAIWNLAYYALISSSLARASMSATCWRAGRRHASELDSA